MCGKAVSGTGHSAWCSILWLLLPAAAILFYGCAASNPTAEQEQGVGEGGNFAPTLVLTAATVPSSLDLATRVPRPATNPKLESTLAQLLVAYQQEGAAGAQAYAQAHRMAIEGSLVEVEILATTDQVASLTGAIEAQGGRVHGHRGTLVQAWVPIGALEDLAERPDVQAIRTVQRVAP